MIGARDQRWHDAVREKTGGRDDARLLGLVTSLRGRRAGLRLVVGLQFRCSTAPTSVVTTADAQGQPEARLSGGPYGSTGQTSTALPVRDRTQRETASDGKDRDGTVRAEVAAHGPGDKPPVEVGAGAVWIVTYMAVIHEKPGTTNALAVLSPPESPMVKKSSPGRRCQMLAAVDPNYKRRQP